MGCAASKPKEPAEVQPSSAPIAITQEPSAPNFKTPSIIEGTAGIGTGSIQIEVHPQKKIGATNSNIIEVDSTTRILEGSELEKQQKAAKKIRKFTRTVTARKNAYKQTMWRMFSDLDTQDEAEMLHLAVFMQTLVDLVGEDGKVSTAADTLNAEYHLHDSEHHDSSPTSVSPVSSIHTSIIAVTNVVVTSDHVSHLRQCDNTKGYNLKNNVITPDVAADIITIFKRGEMLSRKTILRILRSIYKIVPSRPNIQRLNLSGHQKLTVVGDLHGQISDLFHVFDEVGLPNENNKYCFNGDFVDRGKNGIEIVCILFSLYIAWGPDIICLNRGNHEDQAVCSMYGFEMEVKEKYDDLLYEMFTEVFNHLQLFTIVNESVFIVHGGLFHTENATLQDLEEIPRTDYYVKPSKPYPENLEGLDVHQCRTEYLKQLQRDCLWSDPIAEIGCFLNHRGAGVSFGPNIAYNFMKLNKVDMVIRSHEVIQEGYCLPFVPENTDSQTKPFWSAPTRTLNATTSFEVKRETVHPQGFPFLCTLFSASNYCGGDNTGAYLQLCSHPFRGSQPADALHGTGDIVPPLHYTVSYYQTTTASPQQMQASNEQSLKEHIRKKKKALFSAFEAADLDNVGYVSRTTWSQIMLNCTNIKIRWLSILAIIAPPQSLMGSTVNYRLFLNEYSLKPLVSEGEQDETSAYRGDIVDSIYSQRKKLEAIFVFFDENKDGVISASEFLNGCEKLNKLLHVDCQLTDIEHTLEMMDFDGSGTIDVNEFFETFRILDAKDGKVDGVISMAKAQRSGPILK